MIFCAVCGYLIYGAISYKPLISGIALGLIAVGFPLYWLTTPRAESDPSDESYDDETPSD